MAEGINHELIQSLSERFGEKIIGVNEPYGLLTFETHKDIILDVLEFLSSILSAISLTLMAFGC